FTCRCHTRDMSAEGLPTHASGSLEEGPLEELRETVVTGVFEVDPPYAPTEPEVAALEEFPGRFADRELSWLRFNQRVLELAEDPQMPLLERARFLAIFASNLDEFFMVRVAGLKRRIAADVAVRSASGHLPR